MTAAEGGAESLEERVAGVVARAWPGARVTSFAMLAGDASARRYARLGLDGGGAPATSVAMLLPAQAAYASEELTAGGVPTELPFLSVGRFLSRHAIPVPDVFRAEVPERVLLLEDIGDVPLAQAATDGPARGPMEAAVDVLARIAALARSPDPTCCAFRERYDRALIGKELEVVHTHGLAESDDGPARATGGDPELERGLARLGDAIASQPEVFMHRDYHAWNLHIDPAGRLRVIDFQDALLGPALYDLASLCTDRDSHRFVPPELERDLVERFARALVARGGPDLGAGAALERSYFQAVAYRTLRVIGRFRFLAIERRKKGYLRFLPDMARQTRRALGATGDRELLALLAARAAIFA
ncbi:MAG TPA: phosphotransferase [Candidatus Binatia bacterium]|nr:phosphotransferase [Candidatus Binatia bacterium]